MVRDRMELSKTQLTQETETIEEGYDARFGSAILGLALSMESPFLEVWNVGSEILRPINPFHGFRIGS